MSEETLIDRAQAHLVVAALRVLTHRHQRPARVAEAAELLGVSEEWLGVAVRRLVELGALAEVTDAYDARFEVADYLRIEELGETGGAKMEEEIRSFSHRAKEKQQELQKQFDSDFRAGQKRRFSQLEEDLKKFRGGKGPRTDLWGNPIEDDE